MADAISIQELIDARTDAKTLEEAVNGDAVTTVLSRLGETYPTLSNALNQIDSKLDSADAQIKQGITNLFENGGLPATPFTTKALMTASPLVDGDYAMVTDDAISGNNGLYVKTAGAWVKTSYDPLAQAKEYADSFYILPAELDTIVLSNSYVDPNGTSITYDTTKTYTTYKCSIEAGKTYIINIIGDDKTRFRVATTSSVNDNTRTIATGVRNIIVNDALDEFVFTAGATDVELYIYLGLGAVTARCTVSEYIYNTKLPIMAAALENPILTSQIADSAITPSKTSFASEVVEVRDITRVNVQVLSGDNGEYFGYAEGAWSYAAKIKANEIVNIELTEKGGNNRFRVAVTNSDEFDINDYTSRNLPSLDRLINTDATIRSLTFDNDSDGKWVFVTVNTGTPATITVKPIVTTTSVMVRGLNVPNTTEFNQVTKYSIEYGKVFDNTVNIIKNGSETPRLASIKYEYNDSQFPEPVAYLYTTNEPPYKMLYSSGRIDDLKYLADWDASKTHTGALTPSHYTAYITQQGDIVFIYRGDLVGGTLNPEARQNPIIYPAGDYDNPYVVDFGDRIKPTAWARCNGVAPILGGDGFLFNEYTRPAHEKMYIWKVSRPLNNPDNWRRVYELTIDRPGSNHPEGRLKHWHALNYDPWSGAYLATTGDYYEGAKIFMSKDIGETWELQAEGDEALCRLSQFSFDKDAVYWGSDSHGSKHLFIKASRGEDGYPKLGLDDLEVLYRFSGANASITATYNTVRLRNPNGFLFIDFQDGRASEINLHFWSLDRNEMTMFDSIYKLNGTNERLGFRCDALTLYQSYTDDRVVLGFNASSAINAMDISGNSLSNTLANVTLKVTG